MGIGSANPDASLPAGFAGQRLAFELSQIVPLLLIVGIGVVFYVLGKPTRTALASEQQPEPAAGAASAAEAEAALVLTNA